MLEDLILRSTAYIAIVVSAAALMYRRFSNDVTYDPITEMVLHSVAMPSTVALILLALKYGNAFFATLGGFLLSALAAYYIRISRNERRG